MVVADFNPQCWYRDEISEGLVDRFCNGAYSSSFYVLFEIQFNFSGFVPIRYSATEHRYLEAAAS